MSQVIVRLVTRRTFGISALAASICAVGVIATRSWSGPPPLAEASPPAPAPATIDIAPTAPAPSPPWVPDDAMKATLRDFTSDDFARVFRAYQVLTADPDRAMPALLSLLDRTDGAPLRNTGDLIYPCAKQSYGHGWGAYYELDWIADRAGFVIEELSLRDFGFTAVGPCGMTPRAHTAAAIARTRAWAAASPPFHYRDALVDALGGTDDAHARAALYIVDNSFGKRLPGVSCDDYRRDIAPRLHALAARLGGEEAVRVADIDREPPWGAVCPEPR